MVAIKYKGQSYISFGGKTKIVAGMNEISDDLFYDLMKQKLFAARVNSGVFEVPKGFPLERPTKKMEQVENKSPDSKETEIEEKQSLKQALRTISISEDKDFLENLLLVDNREKIQDAAKSRIDALEKSKE